MDCLTMVIFLVKNCYQKWYLVNAHCRNAKVTCLVTDLV
jgi:hypothetical protein